MSDKAFLTVRRQLLHRMRKASKGKCFTAVCQFPNDDVPNFLKALDAFEQEAALDSVKVTGQNELLPKWFVRPNGEHSSNIDYLERSDHFSFANVTAVAAELNRLTELAAKQAPPSEDTKRLDWLENNVHWNDPTNRAKVVFPFDTTPIITLREAIDKALQDARETSAGLPQGTPRELSKEEIVAPPSATTKEKKGRVITTKQRRLYEEARKEIEADLKRICDQLEDSTRLTAKDFAITINAR